MDLIKKAATVVNEYLSDFFQMLSQLPTKDMEVVRQIVGQWPIVKQLLKPFISKAEETADSEYVKAVLEDFKKASILLDKLGDYYKKVGDFDLEGIKTHSEPFIKLITKMNQPEESPQAISEPEAEPAPEVPEEEELVTKEAKRIASSLDEIATRIEKECPQVALALDRLADLVENKKVL
jgi:hypothetical protein